MSNTVYSNFIKCGIRY